MQKTPFLVVFIVLSLSARSQVSSITITHEFIGRTVLQAFKDLSFEHNIIFDYNKQDIPKHVARRRVWKIYEQRPLEEVLKELLLFSELQYKVYGNTVVIRKKDENITFQTEELNKKVSYHVNLSGVIRNRDTGERLAFATVYVPSAKEGTTTSPDGIFNLFDVPSDTSLLQVSYVGFHPLYHKLNPNEDLVHLKLDLIPNSNQLKEVTITATQKELMRVSQKPSQVIMTPKQMKNLPSMGTTDIFRSFQFLPGISASNESSSGLYVRGGTPDQNLILYDGFTVYHVDHLFGMFSAFNANAIKDVELFKGGFESKYGGRLSSVMDITGKEGNSKNASFGAGLSLLSMDGVFEAPLGRRGTFLVAGRRSFQSSLYNTIFNQFDSNNQPNSPGVAMPGGGRRGAMMNSTKPKSYFYDVNAKATFNLKSDRYSFSFFNGLDDLDNSRKSNFNFGGNANNGGVNDLTKWGNWGSSFNWFRNWGGSFYSNTLLSYSNYYSQRDRTSEGTRIVDGVSETSKMGSLEDNDLRDYTANFDFSWVLNQKHSLDFGLQNTFYDVKYYFQMNDTLNIQDRDEDASVHTLFVQDKWQVNKKLFLTGGLRNTYYSATSKMYYEPRLSFNYIVNDKVKVKGAWGNYYQFAKRLIRDDIMSGSRDFWSLANDNNIKVANAQHYILGASYEKGNFLFDSEVYYKPMTGLTEYGLNFTPSFRQLNFDEFFYSGKGYSIGWEILAQKKYGDFTGWVSYTLGQAKQQYNEYGSDYFNANHDVTHEFKGVGMYAWKRWNFSATWVFATGKPYTAPIGAYNVDMADGSSESFFLIGDKNSMRLPNYHRLDLSAKFKFRLGSGEAEIGGSIFNAYNRTNVWYKEFEIIEEQVVETNVNLLGFTPNISFNVKF